MVVTFTVAEVAEIASTVKLTPPAGSMKLSPLLEPVDPGGGGIGVWDDPGHTRAR